MELRHLHIKESHTPTFGGQTRVLEFFVEFDLTPADLTLVTGRVGESGSAAQSRSGHISEVVNDLLSRKSGGLSEAGRAMIDNNWARSEQFLPHHSDPSMVAAWLRHMADIVEDMPKEFHRKMQEEKAGES